MKLAIKLAYRNLIGAGLRTWLNVIVLSFSFVVIIWMKGILIGWDHQAREDMKNWEIGEGQYWQENYDPYDPFTLAESHAVIPEELQSEIAANRMEPVLITQGTLYPQGRIQTILVKGIDPGQELLMLPTEKLDTALSVIPAVIGFGMARAGKLGVGDHVTLQWRDINGTFDATEIAITEIFTTNVPTVDAGQVWIPLDELQLMLMMPGEATLLTFDDGKAERPEPAGWKLKTSEELTADMAEIIQTKTIGQSVFYIILLLLAMLAIFDTQVLSIFRRQREIGTYVALGYTRRDVVWLFTTEGAMHAVLAALVAAAYGIPFLIWQADVGWTLPVEAADYGMTMAQTLYPVYSFSLVLSTVLIVMLATTVVSYWPSKKIAKMNPTEALRGKIQ
jgi:putative ABC transport system permease protein